MEERNLDLYEEDQLDETEELMNNDESAEEAFDKVVDFFDEKYEWVDYMVDTEEDILEGIASDDDLLDPVEPVFLTHEELLAAMEGEYEPDDDTEDTTEEESEEYSDEPEDDPVDLNREPDVLYDSMGNPVEFKVDGEMVIEEIALDDIFLPPRTRKVKLRGTEDLEATILQWGLIEPLHVIPFNGKYLLMHGYRRYQALRNLNYATVTCLVDSTRPKATIRFLEVLCNNSVEFDFFEVMNFGEFIERKQNTFQTETIEKILGIEPGDYLKAKYIRQFDSFGIISEVVTGKKSIKEGFKKLERELAKLEKEREEMENMQVDENGLPESYLEALEEEANVQDVKDRKPLPHHVYARIKARDKYTCQTCGIGYNQPELNAIHEVHHIIPVKQKGSDADDNLVLICSNCHKVVGAYINGEFKAPEEAEDMYTNIVLLGNIAKRGVPEGMTAYGFYMAQCDQPWIE